VIPIKIQNEVIGLLIVVRKSGNEIARGAQTLLEAVADYASISLVNARLFRALEQTAESARSEERMLTAALDSLRNMIREEVQSASYPLSLALSESIGGLTPEQRQALESAQGALQRLAQITEKTLHPSTVNDKPKEG
jgi:GAF domain-containing protein